MSVNLNALKQYQSVDLRATVETASPHKLIDMLFDGALKSLAMAKGSIERGDISERTTSINKATDILVHLQGVLDLEKGGEVAQNLNDLYDYSIRRLMLANNENNLEKVQEVMDIVLEIKAGWTGIPEDFKN